MNILLIENQPLAEMIRSKRADIEVYGGLGQSVEVVAADIKSRLAEHYDVIIIGVHAQIGNALLSDHAGIQLLKLLRLHHIDKHVVLYSWMSREMLMSNLRNAIVFSKGVTFYRLPDFINEVQDLDFDKLSHETANKNELLPLFRAEYNSDDRHFDANMFGVWQLMRVQDAYEKMYEGGVKQCKDDESRQKIYAYLNSYNGKVMQYISGQYSENLEDRLREETKRFSEKARNERLQYAESSIKSVDAELHDIQIRIDAINKLIPVDSERGEGATWLQRKVEERANKKLTRLAMDETSELVQRKVELEEERQHFERMKAWAETPAVSSTEHDEPIKFDNVTIAGVRESLNKRTPRIIYVDDMADKGWADMLKRMVYKNEEDYGYLTSIVPTKNDSVDTIVERICEVQDPQLIILDLRLKDEKGYYAPADLSGFQVLHKLHEKNLPCAILVFTASNKVWSLKEAFKGKVMSFWTKGGLDNMDKTNDGVNNYLDLLCQINHLTNYKWMFELLAKIGEVKRKIENEGKTYWWETKILRYEGEKGSYQRILTKKESIVTHLDNAIQTTQSNLRQMIFFDNSERAKDLMISSFIMRMSDIIEQIHYYPEVNKKHDKDFIRLAVRMNVADNPYVKSILNIRNECAHYGYIYQKEEAVKRIVKYVLQYVLNEPKELKDVPNAPEPPEKGDITDDSAHQAARDSADESESGGTENIPEEIETVQRDEEVLEDSNTPPPITPIEERKRLLEEGFKVTVKVEDIIPHGDEAYFYDFYLEGRNLKGAILYSNKSWQMPMIKNIKKGDLIDVIQNGETQDGKPRYKIIQYYNIV